MCQVNIIKKSRTTGKKKFLKPNQIAAAIAVLVGEQIVFDDGCESENDKPGWYGPAIDNEKLPKFKVFEIVHKIISDNSEGIGYGPKKVKQVISFLRFEKECVSSPCRED